MLPIFAYPLAFAGCAALAALTAIYLLRNRFRRQPVSSLMLWLDHQTPRQGGRRLQRLRTPLLFFLELLIISLLVLAAASPRVQLESQAGPLLVVLDDSFSMAAGGDDSPRQRGMEALRDHLRSRGRATTRFVLAGDSPQAFGDSVHGVGQAETLLEEWLCRSPLAALAEAVTLATEIGGRQARVLVITDHPADEELREGSIEWWSFGRAVPNVAIVNAARSPSTAASAEPGEDRCFVEIANLATVPSSTRVRLAAGAAMRRETRLELRPGESRRLVFDVKTSSPLVVRLDDDALAIDNEAVLVSPEQKKVRVDLRLADEELRTSVLRALTATKRVARSTGGSDLLITGDPAARPRRAEEWPVYLLEAPDAEAYVGPFVVDRSHPLANGLSMAGVVWAAGKTEELPGAPVITAGNTPLVTVRSRPGGHHDVRFLLSRQLSNLEESPDWPILFWNLVDWRASESPGLRRVNLRLGSDAELKTEEGVGAARWKRPDGTLEELPVHNRRIVAAADSVGLHTIAAGDTEAAFAVNAVRHDESDLRRAASGRWGRWVDDDTLRREYTNVAWLLLLLALAVFAAHGLLVSRMSGGRRGW